MREIQGIVVGIPIIESQMKWGKTWKTYLALMGASEGWPPPSYRRKTASEV